MADLQGHNGPINHYLTTKEIHSYEHFIDLPENINFTTNSIQLDFSKLAKSTLSFNGLKHLLYLR